jgi:hypothetical protein
MAFLLTFNRFQRFCRKKHRVFELTVLLLLLISADFAVADKNRAPKMVIKEQEFNFGQVQQGETITHTFEVLNQGDEILTIKRINPD